MRSADTITARLLPLTLALLLAACKPASGPGETASAPGARTAADTSAATAPPAPAAGGSPSPATVTAGATGAGDIGQQHGAPVTVNVCGEPVRYERTPTRVVTHDVNITELFLFLDLDERLVGYSGIAARKEIAPALRERLARIPDLSGQQMSLEAILDARADFVFAGWSYGFRPGEITPEVLAEHGIASYVLGESCIRRGPRPPVAVDDALHDLRRLGRIFRIEERVERKLQPLERRLQALRAATAGVRHRPRVFVYDSGGTIPQTAGRYGMPTAMIEAAGGRNIFDDIASNWPTASWEQVVERNPEWIVIVDYGQPDARGKIDFLLGRPELASVDAIRHRRFFVLSYAEATPGPRNIDKATELAAALHPERRTALSRPAASAPPPDEAP